MATTVAANLAGAAAVLVAGGIAVVHNAYAVGTNVPNTTVKNMRAMNMSAQIVLSTNATNPLLTAKNTNAMHMGKLASRRNATNTSVLNMSYNVLAMALAMWAT